MPNSISGAYSLGWLQLSNNSFIRKLPPNLKNCTQLMGLDIGDNKLSGKVTEWIGNNLLNLAILRLRNNKFYGDIPSSFCQMSKLQIMDLANNQLTGNISRCFGNFSGMVHNKTTREILSKLTFLSHLNLSNNNLSGRIPMGPQLQTLNGSLDYEGNPGLCGAPLAQQCEVNRTSTKGKNSGEHGDDGNAADKLYLYEFVVGGFATGSHWIMGLLWSFDLQKELAADTVRVDGCSIEKNDGLELDCYSLSLQGDLSTLYHIELSFKLYPCV
ncbi:receptor like protein 21 [Striga hermonthica]|uniref:Receptor like protein 21 n=1 Tax=Striga hermonthica TaxID=68872 RepID=A0A9N7NQ77_STRHE|nr:receptor like protein 21 [Striga hermonthica]